MPPSWNALAPAHIHRGRHPPAASEMLYRMLHVSSPRISGSTSRSGRGARASATASTMLIFERGGREVLWKGEHRHPPPAKDSRQRTAGSGYPAKQSWSHRWNFWSLEWNLVKLDSPPWPALLPYWEILCTQVVFSLYNRNTQRTRLHAVFD